MFVIKFGGSLLSSDVIHQCLLIISEFAARKVVIVPGGGVFADQVRNAQKQFHFSDQVAHRMALLSMEQSAYLLQSCAAQLQMADSLSAIKSNLEQDKISIWQPFQMVNDCSDIAQSWDVTSDSLAVWLADKLNAENTVLLKMLDTENRNARELAEAGMVDTSFPQYLKDSSSNIWWINANEPELLREFMADGIDEVEAIRY